MVNKGSDAGAIKDRVIKYGRPASIPSKGYAVEP